jgi:hypothetical protein
MNRLIFAIPLLVISVIGPPVRADRDTDRAEAETLEKEAEAVAQQIICTPRGNLGWLAARTVRRVRVR